MATRRCLVCGVSGVCGEAGHRAAAVAINRGGRAEGRLPGVVVASSGISFGRATATMLMSAPRSVRLTSPCFTLPRPKVLDKRSPVPKHYRMVVGSDYPFPALWVPVPRSRPNGPVHTANITYKNRPCRDARKSFRRYARVCE